MTSLRNRTILVPVPMRDDPTIASPGNGPEEAGAHSRRGRALLVASVALIVLLLGGLGLLGNRILRRLDAIDSHVDGLSARTDDAVALSRQALERAASAENAARAAAEGRLIAEAGTAAARGEADVARHEANSALLAADRARAEAERIRKEAEKELDRLAQALGQVAETRRTALGLVMNLGSDYLKFEFDKAELRPSDRELLSRIAGILLTSTDYTVSVNGHTDDVGTDEYNQKLSARRAEAVRAYLVEAGVSKEILGVNGHGKTRPLVPGASEGARAKNRRVELGIVNTRILYGREAKRAP
jgi:outer membrane protein OmpA-like peptidoglycan-associated protein